MGCSVIEVLHNSQINFNNLEITFPLIKEHPVYKIAKEQLDNSIRALISGKGLQDAITDNNDGQTHLATCPDAKKMEEEKWLI